MSSFCIPAGVRFRGHAHGSVHLCVVLAGGMTERDGTSWRDVGPGTVRVSAAARHDIDFGPDGARCLVLETTGPTGLAPLERLPRPRFLAGDPWLSQVVRRIAAADATDDAARSTVLDGLAVELLAQVVRRLDGRPTWPPSWLSRVRDQLEDTAGGVTVGALAADAGVHRVHLARVFRQHFGVPVTQYARRLRLAHAQRLLVTSSVPLSQVAAAAGFADQSHLTRVLRAATGTTPGAVRRARLHRFKTAAGPAR